jgi:hypothetical protein
MVVICALIFLVWFCVSTAYVFKPKLLGRWANPIHRYGWANRWDMFVPNKTKENARYSIEFRDKNERGEISEWREVPRQKWYTLIFILNVQGRLDKLYVMVTKRLLSERAKGIENLKEDALFSYLCSVICNLNSNKIPKERQIRMKYMRPDSQMDEVVMSDFIPFE